MKIVTRDRKKELINITPLIDVVFILLVFFMLAGSIERPDVMEVEPPSSESQITNVEDDVAILVSADGTVAFQDTMMPDDQALVRTATVWFSARPQSTIQLKADAGADAARVIKVMELLREAGARFLVLLTVGGAMDA